MVPVDDLVPAGTVLETPGLEAVEHLTSRESYHHYYDTTLCYVIR